MILSVQYKATSLDARQKAIFNYKQVAVLDNKNIKIAIFNNKISK